MSENKSLHDQATDILKKYASKPTLLDFEKKEIENLYGQIFKKVVPDRSCTKCYQEAVREIAAWAHLNKEDVQELIQKNDTPDKILMADEISKKYTGKRDLLFYQRKEIATAYESVFGVKLTDIGADETIRQALAQFTLIVSEHNRLKAEKDEQATSKKTKKTSSKVEEKNDDVIDEPVPVSDEKNEAMPEDKPKAKPKSKVDSEK